MVFSAQVMNAGKHDLSDALEVVSLSDIGRQRERNEDAVAVDLSTGLIILADGMGGYQAGDVASEIAVLSILADIAEAANGEHGGRFSPMRELFNAVQQANAIICRLSASDERFTGMGTTLVAGVFADDQLILGHMGDSRVYRWRAQTFMQLTRDHSYVQELVDAGELSAEEAQWSLQKNLVTRALGADIHADLELHEYPVELGDVYLFCSDGLTDMVSDAEIAQIFGQANQNMQEIAGTLVEMANAYGGVDNISVILVGVRQPFMRM